MLTKEQIKQKIASNVINKRRQQLTFGDISTAISNASQIDRTELLSHIRENNSGKAGMRLMAIVNKYVTDSVDVYLNGLLADNVLTIAELSEILE